MTPTLATITCREVIGFLLDYESGVLATARRDIFDAHLAICPDCVDYLTSYRETIRLCHSAKQPELEIESVPEELLRAILAAHPKKD